MPEISLFFDRQDEKSLVQFILEQGGHILADMQESPHCQEINELDSYVAARGKGRLFFVLFDAYQECPLRLSLVGSGCYAGKYSVVPRVGGPAIDLLASVQYDKDGFEWISGGGLSYYSTYENTITGEMERAPDAIVKQYEHIVSHLKKDCKLIKGQSGRKYLIGPHTHQLIQAGKLKLGVKGLSV